MKTRWQLMRAPNNQKPASIACSRGSTSHSRIQNANPSIMSGAVAIAASRPWILDAGVGWLKAIYQSPFFSQVLNRAIPPLFRILSLLCLEHYGESEKRCYVLFLFFFFLLSPIVQGVMGITHSVGGVYSPGYYCVPISFCPGVNIIVSIKWHFDPLHV